MTTELKYWAFISYSHADKKWGNWLHSALETFKVPRSLAGGETGLGEPMPQKIFPIFRDREELPTSSDLGSMIGRALEQSRYLIVICSPRAAKSHWVNQEILDFKRMGRTDRILALIVDGEPNAADGKPGFSVEAECFPEALKYALGGDGSLDKTQPAEPIAADARPGMDGKTDAKLKLVAGVLGINYDDLKRREERRRRRQQRIVISVAAALVLTFAALAGAALWQWRVASHATKIAIAQTHEAERQKTEADTQRRAAETQKTIADEKSVEAENEKEQVETRTAADEEDLGREALLRGDQLTAAQHLSLAYESAPQDPAVRLLVHAAMSSLKGLAAVLRGDAGALTRIEVAPRTGFVLTVNEWGDGQVWNPANGLPFTTLEKSGHNLLGKLYTNSATSFTPDGKRALLPDGSEAYLVDVATDKRVSFSAGKGESFDSAVVSSDGKTVIGALWSDADDGDATQIAAYDSSDGHEISRVGIPGQYTILDSLGSGARVVLVGGPANIDPQNPVRNLLVLGTQTGKTVARIPVGPFDYAQVNPRGDLILVNHSPPSQAPPVVYSAVTGAKVAELSAKGMAVGMASWSPSGRYVFSAEAAGKSTGAAVWDPSTWKPVHVWPDVDWSAAAINPEGSLLATVTGRGEIGVWDIQSGTLVKRLDDRICPGDSDSGSFHVWRSVQFSSNISVMLDPETLLLSNLLFSPDGSHLILAGGGACATVWNLSETGPLQPVLSVDDSPKPLPPGIGPNPARSIAFNQDGSRAVTGTDDRGAVIWDVKTGAITANLRSKNDPDGGAVPTAEFSPDGKEVVAGGERQGAALWNASTGKLLKQLGFDNYFRGLADTVLIAVGRQRDRAVTFVDDRGGLWDMKSKKEIASIKLDDRCSVTAVSFSQDGSAFVEANLCGFASVFDSLEGRLRRKVGRGGDDDSFVAAEIAPANDKVLTADSDGQITVWSMADGRALVNIDARAGSPFVNDVHFSPDGTTIIAACSDGKVHTWNAQTGQSELTVAEETVPGERINRAGIMTAGTGIGSSEPIGMLLVRYSPDGSFFAGANESGHVMVWDAKTGKQLLRFEGLNWRVTSLVFTPDGAGLGISSDDGSARVWDMGLESRKPAEVEQAIAGIHQKQSQ